MILRATIRPKTSTVPTQKDLFPRMWEETFYKMLVVGTRHLGVSQLDGLFSWPAPGLLYS